jgi:hypothetical protein
MRAWWILPNRDQRDDVLASDGKTTMPLRQVLDPRLRPEGFSHGVPAELIERCGPKALKEILFAQRFPNWNGNKLLFSISTPAGADSSGRVVHLGLVFILEPHEHPRFELLIRGRPGVCACSDPSINVGGASRFLGAERMRAWRPSAGKRAGNERHPRTFRCSVRFSL